MKLEQQNLPEDIVSRFRDELIVDTRKSFTANESSKIREVALIHRVFDDGGQWDAVVTYRNTGQNYLYLDLDNHVIDDALDLLHGKTLDSIGKWFARNVEQAYDYVAGVGVDYTVDDNGYGTCQVWFPELESKEVL